MNYINNAATFTVTFPVSSEYGTITEGDFELEVKYGSLFTYLKDADIAFTLDQPVATTYDEFGDVDVAGTAGYIRVTGLSYSSDGRYKFNLNKVSGSYHTKVGVASVEVITTTTAVTTRQI